MLPALFLCRKSKSLSEFLAERFACGCALVVGSVLDGEAVTEELGAWAVRVRSAQDSIQAPPPQP